MMVTYKMVLDERRPKLDGSFAIQIRITENRKVNTITSGISINKDFWEHNSSQIKQSHPNYKLLNQKITEKYLKIQKLFYS
jgi:integrase/recombinase XerD